MIIHSSDTVHFEPEHCAPYINLLIYLLTVRHRDLVCHPPDLKLQTAWHAAGNWSTKLMNFPS